jgi:hypothetical protein
MPAQVSTIPADLPEPGVYYLVSVWSPRVLDSTKPDRTHFRNGLSAALAVSTQQRGRVSERIENMPRSNLKEWAPSG